MEYQMYSFVFRECQCQGLAEAPRGDCRGISKIGICFRYAAIVSILNCFAAGIFLGTCLLHLFPDVRGIIDVRLPGA